MKDKLRNAMWTAMAENAAAQTRKTGNLLDIPFDRHSRAISKMADAALKVFREETEVTENN